MNELDFKCGNPGASTFGNFINYYQFHPPDERISMLAPEMWSSAFKAGRGCALDVGCNSGVCNLLTTSIASLHCQLFTGSHSCTEGFSRQRYEIPHFRVRCGH